MKAEIGSESSGLDECKRKNRNFSLLNVKHQLKPVCKQRLHHQAVLIFRRIANDARACTVNNCVAAHFGSESRSTFSCSSSNGSLYANSIYLTSGKFALKRPPVATT